MRRLEATGAGGTFLISLHLKYLQVILDKQYESAIIVASRRQAFPAPRPMATRQVVLLTPLECSHPQLSPSSHRINVMNTDFPVVDPLYLQTFTGVHFATHLFSCSCRNGGGYTPLLNPDVPTFKRLDVWTIRKLLTCNIYETPRKCCKQKTYVSAKSFSCNTYKKPRERVEGRLQRPSQRFCAEDIWS